MTTKQTWLESFIARAKADGRLRPEGVLLIKWLLVPLIASAAVCLVSATDWLVGTYRYQESQISLLKLEASLQAKHGCNTANDHPHPRKVP